MSKKFAKSRDDQRWLRRKGQKGCSVAGRGKEAPMSCPNGEALKVSWQNPFVDNCFHFGGADHGCDLALGGDVLRRRISDGAES